MTKLSKKDQDWFDRATDNALHVIAPCDAKSYLIQKDAEHKAEIDELNSQIDFKIKECMELAQACSRYKQSLAQHDKQAEIEKLKAGELKSDLLAMCNARRLIKANKRTSNGRLASELFGMGCGSGRDYCRKLGLNPDSNETNYNKSVNQIKEQK